MWSGAAPAMPPTQFGQGSVCPAWRSAAASHPRLRPRPVVARRRVEVVRLHSGAVGVAGAAATAEHDLDRERVHAAEPSLPTRDRALPRPAADTFGTPGAD